MIKGIEGRPQTKWRAPPLKSLLGKFTFDHQFLIMYDCPLLLLGRNLLTKFQARVQAGDPHGEDTQQEK